MVISDVDAGSPAAQGGLRQGMVVYKIGTYTADSVARVEGLLRDVDGGTSVDFVIYATNASGRNAGRPTQVGTVTLVARDES